ncbi:hypothetical protein T02_12557 [Trichinella nativa]|uniref:Uncharacterized protein n=1 Tax=Trichinella nativa TaxID=6335 RepID=A0A0V1LDY1_9BILA|nr:hypothetical protein T02_7016 [Trichinella nativa]KRZ57619.1 hypothetical protein T02_12557 [Trichinella nativa]
MEEAAEVVPRTNATIYVCISNNSHSGKHVENDEGFWFHGSITIKNKSNMETGIFQCKVLLLKGMRIIDIFERKAEEPFNYIEKASITLETVKTPPQVT